MVEMTLKRLMELSGIDIDLPKVSTLLESKQNTYNLIDELAEEIRRKSERVQIGDSLKQFKDMLNQDQQYKRLVSDLGKIIGHDKVDELVNDMAIEHYNEM